MDSTSNSGTEFRVQVTDLNFGSSQFAYFFCADKLQNSSILVSNPCDLAPAYLFWYQKSCSTMNKTHKYFHKMAIWARGLSENVLIRGINYDQIYNYVIDWFLSVDFLYLIRPNVCFQVVFHVILIFLCLCYSALNTIIGIIEMTWNFHCIRFFLAGGAQEKSVRADPLATSRSLSDKWASQGRIMRCQINLVVLHHEADPRRWRTFIQLGLVWSSSRSSTVQLLDVLHSFNSSSSSSECCTGLLEAPFFFIFVPLEFFIPYNMSNSITIIMNMVIVIVRTRWFVHCPLAELCIVPHDLSTNLIVPRNFVETDFFFFCEKGYHLNGFRAGSSSLFVAAVVVEISAQLSVSLIPRACDGDIPAGDLYTCAEAILGRREARRGGESWTENLFVNNRSIQSDGGIGMDIRKGHVRTVDDGWIWPSVQGHIIADGWICLKEVLGLTVLLVLLRYFGWAVEMIRFSLNIVECNNTAMSRVDMKHGRNFSQAYADHSAGWLMDHKPRPPVGVGHPRHREERRTPPLIQQLQPARPYLFLFFARKSKYIIIVSANHMEHGLGWDRQGSCWFASQAAIMYKIFPQGVIGCSCPHSFFFPFRYSPALVRIDPDTTHIHTVSPQRTSNSSKSLPLHLLTPFPSHPVTELATQSSLLSRRSLFHILPLSNPVCPLSSELPTSPSTLADFFLNLSPPFPTDTS
ncbi:hypothetical protein VP01_2400g3 [Puccinia sorghi]|uniref:Uncharacterized protein n=1 Tax=Puccinia sorghi TaxID=27349 RepID=A0A0L6V6R7_9BASI|nr:hypothetical protein VP01_2400g3 [Puccinia sorghi]